MSKFRWPDIVDVDEVRKTISTLKPNNQLFEVRIFGSEKKGAFSGYFTDCDTLLEAFNTLDLRGKSIYISLNKVNDDLYSRSQHDKFEKSAAATSDSEIDRYEWLFVDLDPKRIANVSSTNTELKKAENLTKAVKEFLHTLGFAAPVEAMSGNGYHLLYRIDLPTDQASKDLVKDCMTAIADKFNNDAIKIDTVNYNPARVCKLYGTKAQKGSDTKTRPHRMSKLLVVPEEIQVTELSKLEHLASFATANSTKAPERPSEPKGKFDLRDWLSKYGISYREGSARDSELFLLDECPFDHSHTNGDARIFHYTDGAIAFKCHHNSCQNYKWQDVRKLFEPDAYDRPDNSEAEARIEAAYQQHKQMKSKAAVQTEKKQEKKVIIRKLKKANALLDKDVPEPRVLVGVGEEIPLLVEGTCILSAKPKLGKSWFALALCFAISNGEDFLGYKTQKCSSLYLDLETGESIQKRRIKKMLNGKPCPDNFYLESETNSIENGFIEQIEAYLKEDPSIGIVVVDVFQIIRSQAKNFKESEYDHAYRDITPLNILAQKYHISIILVCHDRKGADPDDPFLNILGSIGLQGAASQMMVMYRQKKGDPIHISVKGKTIDGLIDLNVKLENAEWSIVEGSGDDRENLEAYTEYMNSPIREVVKMIAEDNTAWKGRCSSIVHTAIKYGVGLVESPKQIGRFLHQHQGRFLKEDGVMVEIINNGTGPNLYRISKFTIDTIDETEDLPLMDFKSAYEIGATEEAYL